MFISIRSLEKQEYKKAAMNPIITAAHGSITSHGAVTATNPAKIPLQTEAVSNLYDFLKVW